MENELKEQTVHLNQVFRTYPLADEQEWEEVSGEALPSDLEVEDAREWVDFKEM